MTTHNQQLLHNGARAARRHTINRLLRSIFGVESLRDGQQQVIDSVLDGKDTLAIMPTGSGKSLCYQIPARILDGTTIVVSPLISLMKDQLEKLDALGVRAVQVNSSLTREEEDAAMEGIRGSFHEIVFCTPERLSTPSFLEALKEIKVALVVIDEAHCISQWGHDFRPAYLEMAAAIDALKRPPVLALTATATDDVVADIARQLGRARMSVVNTGIYRPNLHYRVAQVTNNDERYARALEYVQASEGVGIVYAATVKAAEEMLDILVNAGESATLYHGKLPAAERKRNQDEFMSGEKRVMVATNAFGMGIDKPDTRFVLHLQLPANLEAYYQESGRAGRDGLDAECTLLYFQDDKRLQQFFLVKHYPTANDLKAVYDSVCAMAQEEKVSFDRLNEELDELASGKLKICLKLLKDGKLLRQNRKLEYIVTPKEASADLFEELSAIYARKQERDRESLEQMVSYSVSGFCRWKVLLDYFKDEVEGFDKCCRCDNCLNPPAVAEIEIRDDEFERDPEPAPAAPHFEPGTQVRVPKFDVGTVVSMAGDQVTIEFPEHGEKTFLADYVEVA
ncbi:RecQ family ATP-dependent DNA helicase [Massilia pseudoviolaceinigra]|uniref:RecQ family ATP-dependent DNA helicase n=1 Tax=Massilia pseudoviolaceinigra TaxID=3057165 RepID=UPI002796E090|nr:RecQ family ATP-dependent DNA helicase [Massilia sp. CCM 9206]MDQ1923676.1 RecQ family ATP-dependent DNA helicase [Massilia sp. CCM 9206]